MKALIHRSGRTFITERDEFISEFGKVAVRDGLQTSSKGEVFRVIDPFFTDMLGTFRRGPQITHPKDLGWVIVRTGMGAGWRVVDAGTGTGYAAAYFANIVGEQGRVYTYEKNKKFYSIARRNIERTGLCERIVFHLKDVCEGIEESDIDLVFLDLPEPWNAFEHVEKSLKPGGFLVCYLPSVEQVMQVKTLSKSYNLTDFEVWEIGAREWKSTPLRPRNTGLVHTAFILFSRKI